MASFERNDVGSKIFFRATTRSSSTDTVGHLRLWSLFSSTAFCRRLLESIQCGGGWSRHSDADDGEEGDTVDALPYNKPLPDSVEKFEFGKEKEPSRSGTGRLSDLLKSDLFHASLNADGGSDDVGNASGDEVEAENVGEVRKRIQRLEELTRAASMLQSEGVEDRENGAKVVRRLAKDDSDARSTLAMLGAIPPLILMLDDGEIKAQFRVEALYALLNLGIGNDSNKAVIVQSGAVHKMLKLIESANGSPDVALSEAIVANFLALSALDLNKQIIGSSGAIPFLVDKLKDLDEKCSPQAKQDSLRALYNLSILPLNVPLFLETDLVQLLMNSLGDMETSERILSILSNVVSMPEGRKVVSSVPDGLPILIDVLNWNDSPRCQEMATYILMVMAHKAYGDRQAMIEAGIVSALLELTLVGTTLAQKRASRILEFLTVDKGKQVSENYNLSMGAAVSAPIRGSSSPLGNLGASLKDSLEEEAHMSEEKKAVKQLVQQSLQNNMRRIVKRANLPQDFVPSEQLKSLTASSTSKSLPL
ncbi:hypothetical protein Dimus_010126 [Dionaea muscipula]